MQLLCCPNTWPQDPLPEWQKRTDLGAFFYCWSVAQLLSNSLWPRGLQHIRCPFPSSSPGACSNSCPLSQWCHPTISSSVVPFSSSLKTFPASGSFLMSQLFGQILELQLQHCSFQWIFRTDFVKNWLVWSSCYSRTLKSLLQHRSSKASILWCSAFFMVQCSHPCMTTGKTIALTRQTFVGKVMSLLFNTLSSFVIAFLPRSKYLSISWLLSTSAVILESKKINLSLFPLFPYLFAMNLWDQMTWS